MIRPNALAFFILTAVSAAAHAAPHCVQRVVSPGDVLAVEASATEAVHITLPEPVIKDLVAVPALWDAHFDPAAPMHYWVRAKSVDADLGASSTLTLITASGMAYDFRLQRVERATVTCFTINDSVSMASSVVPLPPPPANAEPAAIFTRYDWQGQGIERVHDDGRYTYIRLSDAQGVRVIATHAAQQGDTQAFRLGGAGTVVGGFAPKVVFNLAVGQLPKGHERGDAADICFPGLGVEQAKTGEEIDGLARKFS